MTVAEDLIRVRELINIYGICKNVRIDEKDKISLPFAVQWAAGSLPPRQGIDWNDVHTRTFAMESELDAHLPKQPVRPRRRSHCTPSRAEVHSLTSFNDAPKTTSQDVLNLIEKALAELGAMGGK